MDFPKTTRRRHFLAETGAAAISASTFFQPGEVEVGFHLFDGHRDCCMSWRAMSQDGARRALGRLSEFKAVIDHLHAELEFAVNNWVPHPDGEQCDDDYPELF